MITGTHAVLYAEDPDQARAFFRDVLGWPHVEANPGWLIFRLPPAEVGIHPTDGAPSHELYLACDDIDATVAELRAKGVEFTTGVEERRFGLMTRFRVPGAGEIGLYQPSHPTAHAAE